jgi:hypothetical protein
MFRWRRRRERRSVGATEPAVAPSTSCADRSLPDLHRLSDLWPQLQAIAREEDARFASTSVLEHFQRHGAEGARDLCRWLEILRQRTEPGYRYRFPDHHPRHRGYCLVERNWPTGITWEAYDEATLLRLDVPAQSDRAGLERAIDERLRSPEQA